MVLFAKEGADCFRFLFLSLCSAGVFWCFLSGYTKDYTYRNIRARINRNQRAQAQTFFRAMLLLECLALLCVSGVLYVFATPLSTLLFGSVSYWLLILMSIPVLIFLTVSNLFVGLFLGEGVGAPILITEAVSILVFVICVFISQPLFEKSGFSVSMLLRNSDMEVAYAALGILLSMAVATFVRCFIYVIFYNLFGKQFLEDPIDNGSYRNVPLFMSQIVKQIFSEMILHVNVSLPFILLPVLCVAFGFSATGGSWMGYLSGLTLPLMMILFYINKMLCNGHLNEIAHIRKLDDFKKFKASLAGLYQGILITVLPVCAYVFAAADLICKNLGYTDDNGALVLRFGSVQMILFIFIWVSRKIMRMWKIPKAVALLEIPSVIAGILFLIVLRIPAFSGLVKTMTAMILIQFLILLIESLVIHRRVKLHTDLVDDWIKPALCAFIAAFVIFVMISAFGNVFAPLIALVATAVFYAGIFVALVLALRCIHISTARYLPGSRFWMKLAEVFHLQ